MLGKIKSFFNNYEVVIIVNTSTDIGLVCLKPKFELIDKYISMEFNSLHPDKKSNFVEICKIHEESEGNTIYFENLEGNILMLQELTISNYIYYIKNNYINIPKTNDIKVINEFIINQL